MTIAAPSLNKNIEIQARDGSMLPTLERTSYLFNVLAKMN